MPKYLILSDSAIIPTGFRNQSLLLAEHLVADGNEVFWLCPSHIGMPIKGMTLKDGRKLDFTMLPGGRHPHALDVLPKHMLDVKPDIFFCLLDSFMLYPNILDADMPAPRTLWWPYKSALWYPSDGGYFPQDCEKVLQKFNRPVAMSKWGQLQIKNQFNMDVDYIPHGTKTNLFVPFSDEQKRKLRMKYGKKLNRDLSNKFVVGMVARNQPRKFMDRAIKSFTLFAKGKDDVLLLLHSDANDPAQPWPVNELINRFSIGHKVEWTGMKAHEGYADSNMSEVYNLFNVKLDTTCILPDMDVTTSIGPKFIQDVKVGDKVLTSAGKYRKVLRTIPTKNWKGKILKIKADGIPELKVTTSHQIYRVPCKGMNDKKKVVLNPEIILDSAATLKKHDYLIRPIPKTTETIRLIRTERYIKECRNQYGGLHKHGTAHELPDRPDSQ